MLKRLKRRQLKQTSHQSTFISALQVCYLSKEFKAYLESLGGSKYRLTTTIRKLLMSVLAEICVFVLSCFFIRHFKTRVKPIEGVVVHSRIALNCSSVEKHGYKQCTDMEVGSCGALPDSSKLQLCREAWL